jgi:hypothetical protein
METRAITLHAFCSAKGGVGKSTLAVACAKLLARAGRTCVVIDADLTGTSLADGLRLCAPDVVGGVDGKPNLTAAPTGRLLTRRETVARRNARKNEIWEVRPPAPTYLNDILIHAGERDSECCVEALFWKHEEDDGIKYFPSSPLPQDIGIALGWLYHEEAFAWLQRLTWLLDGMGEQMSALSDVVIDLPPGLFGFTHEVLALLSNLELGTPLPSGFPDWTRGDVRWRGNPMLVTTPDRNDIVLALEYYLGRRTELPNLRLLLNRYAEGRWQQIREAVRDHFGGALTPSDVDSILDALQTTHADELAPLGEIFARGELRVDDGVQALGRAFHIKGIA